MNRFKLSITNLYEQQSRNSVVSAFISLAHFVTSRRTARHEQVVKQRVRVVISHFKKNHTQNKKTKHHHKTKKKVSDHCSPIKSFQKQRNISVVAILV